MKVDILIATYAKDLPYLRYNALSIEKFCHGFGDLTLAVAVEEVPLFKAQFPKARIFPYDRDKDPQKWQINAQAVKCMADMACPGADFILHTDSDCIFLDHVTPDDYFVNGKPVMVMEAYDRLPKDFPWKPVTEKTLGFEVKYEFMRRHPQVNPWGIYADLRKHIEKQHQTPFIHWVLAQKATFPWGFTEHNAIGGFAFKSRVWHDKYHWHDLATTPAPACKLRQFWSHSAPELPQSTPDGSQCTPLEFATTILNK